MTDRGTRPPLTVCLIASELLGWGKAGGFGFDVRSIARGLAGKGHAVSVVLPCPRGQQLCRFEMDGFRVISYPRRTMLNSGTVFRGLNADIYHSQEPSLATYLAQRAAPDKVHLITSRDPRTYRDWWIELRHPTLGRSRSLLTIAAYENPATYRAVRRANRVFVPARCLVSTSQRKYGLAEPPEFLPTPIRMPDYVRKTEQPTVCFVGRLDRRKQPERFLSLAECFPEAIFKIAGTSQDPDYEMRLRDRYRHHSNIEFLGFIDQFSDPRLSKLLNESWVMVNTSAREGLPNSFIEAAGHGCAIVSQVDPDQFASQFGAMAHNGDYAAALAELLDADTWRRRGAAGRRYVQATNDPETTIELHLEQYYRALAEK